MCYNKKQICKKIKHYTVGIEICFGFGINKLKNKIFSLDSLFKCKQLITRVFETPHLTNPLNKKLGWGVLMRSI